MTVLTLSLDEIFYCSICNCGVEIQLLLSWENAIWDWYVFDLILVSQKCYPTAVSGVTSVLLLCQWQNNTPYVWTQNKYEFLGKVWGKHLFWIRWVKKNIFSLFKSFDFFLGTTPEWLNSKLEVSHSYTSVMNRDFVMFLSTYTKLRVHCDGWIWALVLSFLSIKNELDLIRPHWHMLTI